MTIDTKEKRHNILFLSRTSILGGAQKTLLEIMKRLDKRIFNPILILPDKNGIFYTEALKHDLEIRLVRMPFLQVTYNPFKLFIFMIKIFQINIMFFSLIKKLDIEMVICNLFQESLYIGFASRMLRRKMIIYIKGILDKKWKKIVRSNVCDLFAYKIIAVSQKAGEDVAKYLKNTDKVMVIHEGIEKDFINVKFNKEIFLNNYPKLKFKNNDFIILNIGNISELKGQHLLLESATAKPLESTNIKFIFLGEVWFKKDLKYKNYLLNFIEQNNLSDRVFFMGYQNNVKDFMLFSDLLVHCPTLDDCFPMVILESLSLGKLVVATSVGGIPEMIEDGVNGFLCKVDKEDLADKILYVYNNQNKLEHIKENAIKTVKEKFTLEKQLKKTEEVYRVVLGLK
jgi:glycosyltransferase involved in cell wall biosynthesis